MKILSIISVLLMLSIQSNAQLDTMIVYDITSHSIEKVAVEEYDTTLLTDQVSGSIGQMGNITSFDLNFPQNTPPNSSFSPLEMTKEDYDLLTYPIRTSVAIVWYDSIYEQYSLCSGTLIANNIVLTAAHCIGTHNSNDVFVWRPEGMHVAPSFSNGFPQPEIGKIKVEKYIIFNGWYNTNTITCFCDIGLLILEEPIGNLVGSLGFGYNYDSSFYFNNVFYHLSYPSLPEYEGKDMFYFFGNFNSINMEQLRVENGAYGTYGMSGSGFFYTNNLSNILYGQMLNPGSYLLIRREQYYPIIQMINQYELDIEETLDEIELISISPNPIKDNFNIDIEPTILYNSRRLDFTLYNSLGIECLTIKNIKESNILIKRDNLKSGMHYYILNNGSELIGSGKLIIK